MDPMPTGDAELLPSHDTPPIMIAPIGWWVVAKSAAG